ncbi:MAG: hypothetical protein JXA33_24460 [Anaerolineae bacterium]|nr:hypothetical protein [Anaerolineae bacterium]
MSSPPERQFQRQRDVVRRAEFAQRVHGLDDARHFDVVRDDGVKFRVTFLSAQAIGQFPPQCMNL